MSSSSPTRPRAGCTCAASRATSRRVKAPLLTSGRLLDVVARSALVAASDAATTTLLNCYLREGGAGVFDGDELVLPGLDVRADVTHRSAFFHHRFRGARAARRRAARGAGAGRAAGRGARPGRAAGRVPRAACARASTRSRPSSRRARDDVERLWSAQPAALRGVRAGAAARPPAAPDAEGLCGRLRAVHARAAAAVPAALAVGRRRHRRPRQRDRHARAGARGAAARARGAARAGSSSPPTRGRRATSRARPRTCSPPAT